MRARRIGLVAVLAVFWGGAAQAQPWPFTIFTSRADWTAAAGAVTTVDFEGVAPSSGYAPYDTPQGYSVFGLRFVGVSPQNAAIPYYLRIVHPGYNASYNWGSGAVLHGPSIRILGNNAGGPGSALVITPPADTYAFGLDLMTTFDEGDNYTVQVRTPSGTYTTPGPVRTALRPTRTFFGLALTERILEVRLWSFSLPVIDNVSFSASAQAPGVPRNLTASAVGTTVNISWGEPLTGGAPSTYELLASVSPGGPPVASLSTASTSLQVPGVPNGTYYLRVRAANAQGQSALSNDVTVTVGQSAGLLTLQPVAPIVAGQVLTLSWQSTPVTSSYTVVVQGGPGIGGPVPVTTAGCCTVSLPVPAAIAPGTYRFVVSVPGLTSNPIDVQILPPGPFTLSLSRTTARAGDLVTFSWHDLGLGASAQYQLLVAPSGTTSFGPLLTSPCCSLPVTIPAGAAGAYDLLVRAPNARDSNVVTLQVTP